MYTLVRKEEKKNRKYEHLFYIREKPQLVGYTNYRDTTERFEWKIVDEHIKMLKESNEGNNVYDIDLKNIKKCNIIFDRTNSGDLLFESIMVD